MATLISASDRKSLYTRIYHRLGAPIRTIELVDEQLDSLLLDAVEDYSKFINEWLIEQQWGSLAGLSPDNADINFGLMTKSLDFARSFSYAYSKQIGHGTNAPAGDSWELKKDFVTLSAHTQNYIIPKGREVNEVLWSTPPMIGSGYDPLNSTGWAATEFGWSFGGATAGYVQPMFSVLLAGQDAATKNKIIKSELTYKITGLATGEKLLHLYPVPGGNFMPLGSGLFNNSIEGYKVWYWYYETNNKTKNKCKKENSDVIKTFNDVPVDNLTWADLNDASKTWVRNYLLALAKETLGKVRGKYSGQLNVTDVSLTLDYADLASEAISEKDALRVELKDRLALLSYESILEKEANKAQSLNNILKFVPMKPQMF